jgi:hypothetical protein
MAPADPPPQPDPEKAQRTRVRLYWASTVVCLLIAMFLASDIVGSHHKYDALAWIGVVLSALSILGLAAAYAACATDRLKLEEHVAGRATVFHVTTILLVVAIGADILIPDRDTGALALLLPWGIGYWLHNLRPAKPQL